MPKKKILVVDDNPGIIRLNKSLLESQGYEVLTATDGLEGFRKAEIEKPDLVFLDIILPSMHGFEVCKKLRENPETRHIPIVIITATGLEDIAKDEPDIHADGYIKKPYGLEELIGIIKEIEKKQTLEER